MCKLKSVITENQKGDSEHTSFRRSIHKTSKRGLSISRDEDMITMYYPHDGSFLLLIECIHLLTSVSTGLTVYQKHTGGNMNMLPDLFYLQDLSLFYKAIYFTRYCKCILMKKITLLLILRSGIMIEQILSKRDLIQVIAKSWKICEKSYTLKGGRKVVSLKMCSTVSNSLQIYPQKSRMLTG